MKRAIAIVGLLAISGICYLYSPYYRAGNTGLEVKYRYLVVYAEGPLEWNENHRFSFRWQGKDLELPIVFRVSGFPDDFKLGSPGEIFGQLEIGDEKVAITAIPDTKFQVRNTGIFAFVPEKNARRGAVAISIANSVAISPPEHPGELSPIAKADERDASKKKLEIRLAELIATGRVIEINLGK